MHSIVLPSLASLALALTSVPADAFLADERTIPIEEIGARRWIGAAWQPSRLQDWRLDDGRLVNDDSRLPVRTAHVLPLRIDPSDPETPLTISVDVRIVGGGPLEAGAFAGLLFGAGGPDVDPRLTALVQQVPAPDGGMLAVVAGGGTGRLLDFSTEKQGGFSWALPAKTRLEELEAVPEERVELRQSEVEFRRFTLEMILTPRDGLFDVDLSARDGDAIFTVVSARGLDRARIDGGIALVGHRGSTQGRHRLVVRRSPPPRRPTSTRGSTRPITPGVRCSASPTPSTGTTTASTPSGSTPCFPPVAASDLGDVALEFETRDGIWRPIATGRLVDDSFTVTFDVDDVEEYLGREYRVRGALNGAPFEWRGEIHAPPVDRPLRIASLNCVKNVTAHSAWNRQGVWFPHDELVAGVAAQDPDFLFFAGDQIYEGDLNGVDRRKIMLDYHTKYQRWLRSFAELCRDRPCVIIPDDHDVYHGNIWGAGGVLAKAKDGLTVQDSGGYKLRADVVNAIHRTQVGNLPPCVVPGPIGQGIQPYTTRVRFGPADFAVVADRMWKDSASVKLPEAKVRNGWFRNPDFDPKDADVPDAMFLGPTQEAFLEDWAASRDPRSPRKIVLSQTPWVNVATLPPGRDDGVVPA